MSSHSMHHSYIQEPLPSFPVQYAPDRKSPCPQCCQTHEARIYHHQAMAQTDCTRRPHSSTCECNYNTSICSRHQPCCPSASDGSATVFQSCNCHGLIGGAGYSSQNCSCIQQQQHQHQQSHAASASVSPSPYLHSRYPMLPVHHISPSTVSFSPMPISGALAFPRFVSSVHHGQPEMVPNRMDETYFQRHMGNASSSLEDSSHYHTHIHHHIHRYQHYPFSCVSIGHHSVPSVPVQESHSNQSRHHWRHISSRATTGSYPYLHLPFHYHPYRVIPTSSIARNTTAPAFMPGTVELDQDEANLDWTAAENQSAEPRGLTKLEVEQLPSYIYKGGTKNSSENTRCVVCICDFESDEMLRILPCSHEFHCHCVDKWLKSNPTCPICRAVVHVPL